MPGSVDVLVIGGGVPPAGVSRSRTAVPACALPQALARYGAWEREPERLGAVVGDAARAAGATRVIIPAVLGLEVPGECGRAAARAAGVALGEALGGWPSIPGWRLDRALLRALAAAGVEVRLGRAAAESGGGRVTAVRVDGGEALRPGTVVLAAGKFAGGGIAAEPTLREPALGLPVWLARMGERFTEAAPLLTTSLARAGEAGMQPLLAAGVHTDDAGRPVDPAGTVVSENVFVAGSVRAGRETVAWGLADTANDGWQAGLRAAGAAGAGAAGAEPRAAGLAGAPDPPGDEVAP